MPKSFDDRSPMMRSTGTSRRIADVPVGVADRRVAHARRRQLDQAMVDAAAAERIDANRHRPLVGGEPRRVHQIERASVHLVIALDDARLRSGPRIGVELKSKARRVRRGGRYMSSARMPTSGVMFQVRPRLPFHPVLNASLRPATGNATPPPKLKPTGLSWAIAGVPAMSTTNAAASRSLIRTLVILSSSTVETMAHWFADRRTSASEVPNARVRTFRPGADELGRFPGFTRLMAAPGGNAHWLRHVGAARWVGPAAPSLHESNGQVRWRQRPVCARI